MNEMKQYVHDIEKKLRVDRATRRRIMSDLASDLQSRLDGGETAADIRADLGEPEQVAAIDPIGLYDHYRRILRESPVHIFYAGSAELERIAELMKAVTTEGRTDLIDSLIADCRKGDELRADDFIYWISRKYGKF